MSSALHRYDYYLHILMERKRLVLAVAIAVMAAGVAAAYALKEQYEARSTVFLEQNVITDLVKGIAVSPSVESKIKMLSVALLSRNMMLKVVKELDKDLLLKSDRDLEDYLAEVTRRTRISYQEKQGVFQVSFRDNDRFFARDFVNTLTRKYIDENTSSKREESLEATRFLAEQIETFKRRIDAADEAINRYKSEKGYLLATDDLFLRGEIVAAEKKLEEFAIKRAELEAKRSILLEHGPDPGRSSEAEARLAELLGRYTEDHPKVAAARAEVARLRQGRGEPSRSGKAGQLQDSARMLQVEIDAYKEMETRQARILEQSKNLLRDVPAVKTGLAELVRKKENESVVYQQLVARYGQSEVSKQMELQDKSVTFRILDPAVTPQTPVSPNRFLIIVGAMAGGLAAGIGLVLLADMLKGGVRTPLELRGLDIPVVVVLPHVPDAAAEAARRRNDRIVMGLAAGCFVVVLGFAVADMVRLPDNAVSAWRSVSHRVAQAVGR